MPFIRTLPALLCASTLFGDMGVSPNQMMSPVYLEPNQGQADSLTAFVVRGLPYATLLQHDGTAVYRFWSAAVGAAPEDICMELRGSQGSVDGAGEQPLPAVTQYYAGHDPRNWRAGIPHYRGVRARHIYPGIDMVWRSRGPGLEYEFVVDAQADPGQIEMRFRGAHRVWLDSAGNLVAETRAGTLRQHRPVAWQEIAGKRVPVGAGFRLHGDTAGFRLEPYDRHHKLWVDPVLSYSSYLGGAGYDAGYAIAVDGSGNAYITGTTGSVSFSPTSGLSASRDAFVTKFSSNGSIVYTTILSSSADDSGQAIAVDTTGNVYVAGSTGGNDFPATQGVWQPVSGGGEDGFAAKLNPSGRLVYASYIGGAGNDYATGIAIDQPGNAYISGYTSSTDFPTTPGAPQPTYGGGPSDAFIVKLNPTGSAATFATLLGGSGLDQAQSIALDPAGNVCIAGYTNSTDLPVLAALQSNPGGDGDALIACLDGTGTAWVTVSYLGGSGLDQANALAIDASGNLYVAGTTFSQDFPTTLDVFQPAPAGSYDAFLAELGPRASNILDATLLGGSGSDAATALALGNAGDVWLGGYTASSDFPLAAAWQASNHGSLNGFVAHLSSAATTLLASSYLGGSQEDQVLGIALNSAGLVMVTGSTGSTDFPVTAGAVQSTNAGGYDAFLAQINTFSTGYAISGQVTVSGGAPLGGANLSLSGVAGASTTTDASGNYCFNGLVAGAYTVTPSAIGYSFSPLSQTFDNLSGNQIAANFAASPKVNAPPSVNIDVPAPGAVLSGTVSMAGWAIDNTSAVGTAISSVPVFVDGVLVGTAAYGVNRSDVCAVYPERVGCPNVGFNFDLNTAALSPGAHTITVYAVDSDVPSPEVGSANVTVTVPATAGAPSGPPSVNIDIPAPNTVVSGTVLVVGWAIDNASAIGTAINPASLQVKVDGVLVGTATYGTYRSDVCAAYLGRAGCPNVGFTYSLNAAALSPGSHTITVYADDSDIPSPHVGSASVTITVSDAPPSVNIDIPAPNAAVSGTILVTGWAIDNASAIGTAINPDSLQVKVDGYIYGTATYGLNRSDVCAAYPGRAGCPNVGFNFELNTAPLNPGAHTITVSATDTDPAPDTGSASVTVAVGGAVRPSVNIDAPVPNVVISGMVSVTGWAIDNTTAIGTAINPNSLQVFVDGVLGGTATYGTYRSDVCAAYPGRPGCPDVGYTFNLDTLILSNGPHTITIWAADTDASPNIGSASINVTVLNGGPSVNIDAPAPNAVISGTVLVTGWTIDNATAIGTAINPNSLQVLVDGVLVGMATYGGSRSDVCAVYPGRPGCPYVGFNFNLNTSGLAAGPHTINVHATDTNPTPDTGLASVTVSVP
jgi:hypothetical protein